MSQSEAEIRALLNAYCERLDAGDFDGVAELFRHGVFRSPRGTNLEGAEAVRSQYDAVIRYDDGTPRTKHVLGTVVVEVDDDAGTAAARCAFTVFQAAGAPLQPVLTGRYHDRFERVDGAWCFRERFVYPDLEGDLSRHMQPRA
jgi:3-phenylpropionate/cinnamic acid dioxygenase small subunit